MDLLKALKQCLTGSGGYPTPVLTSTSTTDIKHPISMTPTSPSEEELVNTLLHTLLTTDKSGPALQAQLRDLVHTNSWASSLAQRLLDGLVHALNTGAQMGGAMKEAFEKASFAAEEFTKEHPVIVGVVVTVVAIGILVLLVPWAVEALGFAELGPLEGSWAAFWQSTFPDAEAGSLFSYLQRLGMKWGKK